MRRAPFLALASVALALGLAAPAHADPIVVKPGKVVLPLSGLELDLPKDKRKGHSWLLSASFSFDSGFDARDVLDEKVGDDLIAGTWVLVGYFTAGECKAVVAGAAFEDALFTQETLYGLTWQVASGIYDFESDLGKVPAVALCTERPDRKALLIYHFFVEPPATRSHEGYVAALAKKTHLERITKSWQKDRTATSPPLRRPEVRNRGQIAPSRTATLKVSGLTLTLPDDGFGWLPRPAEPGAEATVDWFDRMAPALPELTCELARVPDASCQEVFDNITMPRAKGRPTKSVPEGWTVGPVLDVDGDPEHTVCREIKGVTYIVGVFNDPHDAPEAGDFTSMQPMLQAIVDAASK